MKKIDDSRIYFYFAIIALALGIIMGAIAYYSILGVEPEIRALLDSKDSISKNYKEAFSMLKDPQIFARYENFDGASRHIKTIIADFDKRIAAGEELNQDDMRYIEVLLERRMMGSALTRNTMVFFLLLSLLGWGMFAYEKIINKGA
jgi:hypothetical protein